MRFVVVVVASLAVALASSGCRRLPATPGAVVAGPPVLTDLPPRRTAALAEDPRRAGEEHLLAGRFEAAAVAFAAVQPDDADAWRQVDLAFALAMAGRPDEAIRLAERVLPTAGAEVGSALHFDLALAYNQRGDPGRAAAELARADALRPDPRLRAARRLLLQGTARERPPLHQAAELARRSLPSAPVRDDEDLDWWLVQHQIDAATAGGHRVDLYVFTACETLGSWCQTAVVAVRQPARDVADVLGRAVLEHEGHAGSLTVAGTSTWRLRTALRRGVRPRWRDSHLDLRGGTPTVVASGTGALATR
jgi:hypothetical protein